MVSAGSDPSDGYWIYLRKGPHVFCEDHSALAKRLKFCAVELLTFDIQCSEEVLHNLLPSKLAWKNATVHASTHTLWSAEEFTFAFTDLLFCKKIRLEEFVPAGFVPTSFLRLPAMIQCNELDIGHLPHWLDQLYEIEVTDIVEWLEREDRKKWGEPSRLSIAGHAINGGPQGLIEALKKVFLAASCPNPYVVRIRVLETIDVAEQHLENKTTHEEFQARMDKDEYDDYVLVERK